jgi:hypothetical protein
MRPRLARRLVLFGAVLGLGCYSPTLPLPPPLKPEISMTESGAYHLKGGVLPDSQVAALNERTSIIDGQQSDHVGNYSFDLKEGQPYDVIELWYRTANDLSSPVAFELPDFTARGGAGGRGGTGGTGNTPGGAGGAAGEGGAP